MAVFIPTYLHVSRHGVFYFRRAVPKDLRPLLGSREIKHSLKIRERHTAIHLARQCTTHYETLFATLQEQPVTYLEMKQLTQDAKATLWEDLKHGLENNGPLDRDDRRAVNAEIWVLRTLQPSDKLPLRHPEFVLP